MQQLILLFLFLGAGLAFQKVKWLPQQSAHWLNAFVINISLPALALLHIPAISFSAKLIFPVATAWIVFLLAVLLFKLLQSYMSWDKATVGCLILTCGLCNTSFIGFPIVKALYGAEGMQTAILVDQPGSFLVLSTLGVIVGIVFSGSSAGPGIIFKKILFFPPFIAFLSALLLKTINFEWPEMAESALSIIGATITPAALLSVGLQLKIKGAGLSKKTAAIGLFYKLILAPLSIYLLYVLLFNQGGISTQVSILLAAMAPMISGGILAIHFNLKPQLANFIVGVGIPIAFVTVSFWYLIISGL
ncbi:MAG: AEC family transporter [Chitinophagales bacterium]